jgi:hypothetical protein
MKPAPPSMRCVLGMTADALAFSRVYSAVGFGGNTPLLIQSINNIVGLIGEALCILFIDKTGRRMPLIWGNILSGSTFAVATALAKQFADGGGSYSQGIAFVAMVSDTRRDRLLVGR